MILEQTLSSNELGRFTFLTGAVLSDVSSFRKTKLFKFAFDSSLEDYWSNQEDCS